MFKIVIDSVSKDSGFQLPVEPATSSLQAACKLLEIMSNAEPSLKRSTPITASLFHYLHIVNTMDRLTEN